MAVPGFQSCKGQLRGLPSELTNTHNDPFNSVSEVCFFTHPRRHRTTTPTHGGITADPEYCAISGNVRSQHRLIRYSATLRASFCRPLTPLKISSRVTLY